MIEVNNLEKTWRRGRTRVGLLPVSFTVPDGQIVGVLVDNGAGKTTLLRTMAGLLPPKTGTALFDGKPAARQYDRISYITGEGSYYPSLTVGEYGAFLEDLHSAFDPKRYRSFWISFSSRRMCISPGCPPAKNPGWNWRPVLPNGQATI